jgi:hypothetical protein
MFVAFVTFSCIYYYYYYYCDFGHVKRIGDLRNVVAIASGTNHALFGVAAPYKLKCGPKVRRAGWLSNAFVDDANGICCRCFVRHLWYSLLDVSFWLFVCCADTSCDVHIRTSDDYLLHAHRFVVIFMQFNFL